MYTTLNRIRECSPCTDGWETLLKYLGKTKPDDEPLPLLRILDSNGLDHALWCFRAVEGFEKEKLLLAITYARDVEHLMPTESKKSLDVFERYVNGLATHEEFETARASGDAAAYAYPTYSEAYYAAWATCSDAAAAAAAAAACSTILAKQETQLRQLLERTCTQL